MPKIGRSASKLLERERRNETDDRMYRRSDSKDWGGDTDCRSAMKKPTVKVKLVQEGFSLVYRLSRVEKPIGRTIKRSRSREALREFAAENGYEIVHSD